MGKILILANDSGGLLHFRGELIERLAQKYQVACSVPNEDFKSGLEAVGGKCIKIKMDRRGKNPIKDVSLLWEYIKLIRREKPLAVLTYTIKPNVYGGIASYFCHVPYISNITGLGTTIQNGGLLQKISLFLYKIGICHAECVFFQNEQNMNTFIQKKIVTGKTKLIAGSGVNLKRHQFEFYPNETDRMRFLFVGRVMKDKGIGELLSAIKLLSEAGYNVFLDVVGRCEEDYTSTLCEYEKNGILKYHGVQKEVHQFYKNSHCVVLPSYHEGMANVMLEASATGRPVITSRIPGCQETFDEGVTGLGCNPGDIGSLVKAMTKFLSLSYESRANMGLLARKKVEREFDRNIVVSAYLEEIEIALHK